jgi:hypothetical protein
LPENEEEKEEILPAVTVLPTTAAETNQKCHHLKPNLQESDDYGIKLVPQIQRSS